MHVEQRQERIRGRRQKRKLARAARVRRQVLRYLLLCLLLAGGAAMLTQVPWRVSNLERDIVIRGNNVASLEQVRAVLANTVGKPIYKLDPRRLEAQVRSLEAVRYAFVRRYLFPHPLLVVDVVEECPWATLLTDPGHPADLVISETGRLIPISEFPTIHQPAFKIYGTSEFQLTTKQVSQWATWMSYIEDQTGRRVSCLDMRHPHDVRAQDGDLYLKLGSADSSLTRRLGRLVSVMPAIGPYRDRLEYIDLSLDNNIPLKLAQKPDATAKPTTSASSTGEPNAGNNSVTFSQPATATGI